MNTIVDSYRKLKEAEPRLRARDAAARLGISEAELVAAGCVGEVQRLEPDFPALLKALPALGDVTVICRNEAAVHEKKGPFTNPEFGPAGAITHGGPIDLRLFLKPWRFAFAQKEPSGRRSLQIFDGQGVAIIKVYLDAEERYGAFDELVGRFATTDANALALEEKAKADANGAASIDREALRTRWAALQDTHDFFPMLRDLKVARLPALETVGDDFSRELRPEVVDALLERASAQGLSIMVFAGNHGAINIHTGPVKKIARLGKWLNVLDPDFNLHLDTTLVKRAFRVRKPTSDGAVTSIELFDEAGEAVALFFGERERGVPEMEDWRTFVEELEVAHA